MPEGKIGEIIARMQRQRLLIFPYTGTLFIRAAEEPGTDIMFSGGLAKGGITKPQALSVYFDYCPFLAVSG